MMVWYAAFMVSSAGVLSFDTEQRIGGNNRSLANRSRNGRWDVSDRSHFDSVTSTTTSSAPFVQLPYHHGSSSVRIRRQ